MKLNEAVDQILDDVDSLNDELENWKDSLSERGLDGGNKYGELEEATQNLEYVTEALKEARDYLEEPEYGDVSELEIEFEVRKKKDNSSRSAQFSYLTRQITRIGEVLKVKYPDHPAHECLDNAVTSGDDVCFPSARG